MSGVSEEDIEGAYRFILGRPPESAGAIRLHLQAYNSVEELRSSFLTSPEFLGKMGYPPTTLIKRGVSLHDPRMDVDLNTSDAQLSAMFAHIEGNWAALGKNDPHWSVLTFERFKKDAIGDNKDEFYDSGKQQLDTFLAAVDRSGVDIKGLKSCLELGCGVGRITLWLARHFSHLIAADISRPHLTLASEIAKERQAKNIEFMLVDKIARLQQLPNYDCFVSVIVLQHNPPPVIKFILSTVLGKLNKRGLAYFQVPTYKSHYHFSAKDYLAGAAVTGEMEVHALPQAALWRIADEAGCRVLDVREDGMVGSNEFLSNSVLLQKR